MSEEKIKRIVFGTPNFTRRCVVCIIISKGVEELEKDFIYKFERPLLEKLEEIRDRKILEGKESYRLFAFNGKIKIKLYFEKLNAFKLEQWGVPKPPIPLTDNNAFFISCTLNNEDDYEEYRNSLNNNSSWSWSTND
jgi:hypothetical protein